MHITRLRLIGFKSFVEPTELWIEPGLTGVVGPNGCGKSNLLEALRWVMGETSYKAMRASAMEDVIFAGTTSRPERSWAEVTMFVDNSARTAPPAFNDNDVLELSRRIERDMGSAYRVNGRDVRARDVKVLFEDAATGARSPALVRQGQIGELVNAKPEQRRRILEDAAGVAGLHTRRHEAELRLKAAEDNLARIGDVLGGLTSQMEGLKRQARQARRYRELSGEIRQTEALALHLAWTAAQREVAASEAALRDCLVRLGEVSEVEARGLAEEAATADVLPELREAEALKGTIVARLRHERDAFEKEAERLARRRAELADSIARLDADRSREAAHLAEATDVALRLDEDATALTIASETDDARAVAAESLCADSERTLRAAEAALAEATRRNAEERARRTSLERQQGEVRGQIERLRREIDDIERRRAATAARAPDAGRHAALAAAVQDLASECEDVEAQSLAAEAQIDDLRDLAAAARDAAGAARLEAGRIGAEIQALEKLVTPPGGRNLPPIVDGLTIAPGFEMALVAALGDDLDAPTEEAAAIHWRRLDSGADEPVLPNGAEPLALHVTGVFELRRRLRHVGVVARTEGRRLQGALAIGQRLVSREGDLWRWDGFVAGAEAPSPAALRLAERNRLVQLREAAGKLDRRAQLKADEASVAEERLRAGDGEMRRLRQRTRELQGELAQSRAGLATLETEARETAAALERLAEARARAIETLEELHERLLETDTALETLDADDGFATRLEESERDASVARRAHMDAREALQALARDRKQRAERSQHLARERQRWTSRAEDATRQLAVLEARHAEALREIATLDDLPDALDERREQLADGLAAAERERQTAADRHAAAEATLRRVQQELRAAQALVSEAREARARAEAQLEAARHRRAEDGRRIRETLECAPEDCLKLAGEAGRLAEPLPTVTDVERQLGRLKTERDRLGGVNLNADDELQQIAAEHGRLDAERADVEDAVAKLRGGIGQINREAKKRLADAFQTVDGHFRRLFGTLFGGGEARLEMIESEEDPLEGGLEIIAKPPGKKPATLSLLSGGEQTLTALSLIFAVFLTNPSPICVLDEVDAPLDDSNVDRFCTLMEQMASETDTRFLVITHHPMTMARMNRLFGVTMAEKGVSQLVSVDLATAERIVEEEPGRQGAA